MECRWSIGEAFGRASRDVLPFAIPILLLWLLPIGGVAASASVETIGNAPDWTGKILAGDVRGTVTDRETGEVIPFAYIHLEELDRSAQSDRNGAFSFQNVPDGTYTLQVHRIGFQTLTRRITIVDDDVTTLSIEMRPVVYSGESVEVTADREVTTGSNLEHASIKVTGEQLRQELGSTLSSTLRDQPGISERSMGANPGRPVIRGLGDERVVILEDGQKTGDVSGSSGDHAVALDPSTAEEIEIARGPAALEYGSGAIGGIVNVVRHQIPTSVPSSWSGALSTQGNSAHRSGMGAASLTIPVTDSWVLNLDSNVRAASETQTPAGPLTNSGMQSANSGFGSSWIQPWGYAGLSGNYYFNTYGIPPDPDGGHPDGVDIEMLKMQSEGRAEILLPGSTFRTLELRGSFVHYEHAEIESGGTVGSRFDMDTVIGSIKLRNGAWGPVDRGVTGINLEFNDYKVFGSRSPNSTALQSGFFTVQEADFGPLHLEGGLRWNLARMRPEEDRPNSYIGHIRTRSYSGLELSGSAIYEIKRDLYLGTTVMRSWRPPSLEELYSEGPHLAAFAFEIGNPNLGPETGLGTELFVRWQTGPLQLELTGYRNYFDNFLHVQDTGQASVPRADLREFQYLGSQARLYGGEGSAQLQVHRNWTLYGSLSHTLGDRFLDQEEMDRAGLARSEQPLPQIPPLQGRTGLRFSKGSLRLDGRLRMASRQDRLPECPASSDPGFIYPCETPTDGYALLDVSGQYRLNWGSTLQTITINLTNLTNRTYYNHLSLIKEISPEPGRAVQLLYRVYF
ncbi:MAG: TonB-dependent receptor [Balneolaceae bacterium]